MYIDFNKIWLYLDIFAFSSSSHLHFPMACSREFRSGEQVNEAANLLPELGLCSPIHKASPGRSRGGHSMWVAEICVVFPSSSYYEVVLANQVSQHCAPGRLSANSACAAVNCHCHSTEKWQFHHCKAHPKEPRILPEVGLPRGSSLTPLVCLFKYCKIPNIRSGVRTVKNLKQWKSK